MSPHPIDPNMPEHRDVLVHSERADLRAELLAAARRLVDGIGGRVLSLIPSPEADGPEAELDIARGADDVWVVSPAVERGADGEVVTAVVAEAVAALHPATVLIGSTRTGVEVAARLAHRLGVACATECLALECDPDGGELLVERYVYGGRFVARQALRGAPRIAAVQAKRFEPLAPDARRAGAVRELPVNAPAGRVTRVGERERERSQADIGRAEVVVTAGRGLRTQEDLPLLETLASALGGELAGSRPLVERGWFPLDHQVGLSGRTVQPRLYVACGVSGQIEHIAGMRTARTVVAINVNPAAPIHEAADYSVIGDLYEFVPALVEAIRDARHGSGDAVAGAAAAAPTE
jgi:electron transfer flavoprotein alpha subunit